jgi:hypothetical protein
MIKDTGGLLERGLDAARAWEGAKPGSAEERAAAEQATGALVLLDAALSRGGILPPPWEHALAQPLLGGWSSGAMVP